MRAAGRVAVIGERGRVQGFPLAGAVTHEADGAEAVRRAWAGLAPAVLVVVLTPRAAEVLAVELEEPGPPLPVVMPP